jgi:hypothetical protein
MARIACYTSFSYSYLARARVLAATLRRFHPDWTLAAVITDHPPAGVDTAAALAPFDVVVAADALDIPAFPGWMFKHDLVEACTAVKGRMLQRMLATGAEFVFYLDPDIALFAPLAPLLGLLDAASIVLTPHQTVPNDAPPAIRDNERGSMRTGVYNLGCLGVRNDAVGRDFAAWWAARLVEACYDAVADGLFTDQKYCDLVPGLFDRVAVARDPGCNVASWNLSRRPLAVAADGSITAADAPLRFYHFTKIGGIGDTMTERYAGDNIVPYELIAWYKRALAAAEVPGFANHAWHYGHFADGLPIPRSARLLWRDRPDLIAGFADPFAVGDDTYRGWLGRKRPDILAEGKDAA